MKKLAALLITLLSLNTYASSDLSVALDRLHRLYSQLNEVDLVDYRLFLGSHRPPQVATLASQSAACRHPANFTMSTAAELTRLFQDDTREVIDATYDGTDGWVTMLEEQHETLAQLTAALGSSAIKICSESTVPAYSDGHRITFVKVDEVLVLSVELGRPD